MWHMKATFLIIAVVALVGCGAPEGNVTEEKQQEVKEEAKPEEPVAEAKPKPEGVNIEKKLEEREGIYYVKDSDTLYTGKVYELYPDGQKEQEGNLKDGKVDGLFISWYRNGQKEFEANFKDGKLVEGSEKHWNEKGELQER